MTPPWDGVGRKDTWASCDGPQRPPGTERSVLLHLSPSLPGVTGSVPLGGALRHGVCGAQALVSMFTV